MEDEIREVEERGCKAGEVQGAERPDEEEEVEEDDSLECELRNNDSVFSELSDLSVDYVESVDRGASVRGQFTRLKSFRHEPGGPAFASS